ncbi:hypothetical protein [Rhizobium johnstonii]|uniref:hypothetical protein n=1 Tax=Rhizobium johnstonii TaxID=3019933 RepID=UPI002DDCA673|nr:hypothetical protein U8P72_11825 [Rhizobium johnstonii]
MVEEIVCIRDEMSDEARIFFGWRPYAEKWVFPNPVWNELRQAFQEGRDDAERTLVALPPESSPKTVETRTIVGRPSKYFEDFAQ